jgi:hypothetical protein
VAAVDRLGEIGAGSPNRRGWVRSLSRRERA